MREDNNQPALDVLVSRHQPEMASFRNYVIGFVSSLLLTLLAYISVRYDLFRRPVLFAIVTVLALSQFMVQLVYFLHVGREFSPRLKSLVTAFMILVVLILVGGSLWIMHNLNNRVMNTNQMMLYMNSQNSL